MAKTKIVFFCKECGYESSKWLGRCPGCDAWNSFCEEKILDKKTDGINKTLPKATLKKLTDIETKTKTRYDTGFEELNKVLGGGIVDGSLILLGGEPGIGKSTLILELCNSLAQNLTVLYVSGEESEMQVKLRADRLNICKDNIYFLGETNILQIENEIENLKPKVCIIDSIQTMYDEEISSVPGSVSQVREVTARLLNISKRQEIITIVIGHVTKDGNIAGPRLLEHMVDVVLYIEGDRFFSHRIVRGVKNRFGSTNEIGIFEMKDEGMCEIKNSSELFLSDCKRTPGTAICALTEGTSTMLLEVQALCATTYFPMPKRYVTGVDINRLNMIIAVIEKVCNISVGSKDIYVNVIGGLKLNDTSTDLSIAMAIISSYKEIILPEKAIYIGEISLSGAIRNVNFFEKKIIQAKKLGYTKIYGPKGQLEKLDKEVLEGLEIHKIENISEIYCKNNNI